MEENDYKALGVSLAPVIRRQIEAATAPLLAKIKELEDRAPLHGERGPAGKDGPSEETVSGMVARAVAALPPPAPGARGEPGQDGAAGISIKTALQDKRGHLIITLSDGSTHDVGLVAGKDGQPGERGQQGKDGADGVAGKDGAAGLNGKDGADGVAGKDGAAGLNGKDGAAGRDGKDADPAEIAKHLIPEVERAVAKLPAPRNGIDGRDGRDGKDGLDGLSFRDFVFDIEYDGERSFTIKWMQGAREEKRTFALPVMIYRGIFKEDGKYQTGDTVTFGGSSWVATGQTKGKPGEPGSENWQLSNKRGRDGRDGHVRAEPKKAPVQFRPPQDMP